MQTIWQDIRFALRQTVASPGFSLTAVLSLALGIAATVAVFSVIYSAVITPWPYKDFDRACSIWTIDKAGQEGTPGLSGPQIRTLRQTASVEDAVGYDGWNLIVTGRDVPEDVQAVSFTGNAFQFFGLPAMLGRYFLPTEAPDNQDPQPVAILTYQFWRRHYNSDPDIVGRTIQLDHKDYSIIGVMPQRFTWMDADVYLPLKMAQDQTHLYGYILKLKPGVRLEAATAEFAPQMAAISLRMLCSMASGGPCVRTILFAAFSGLALTLAAVGLYSVVSYGVAQRTNEFGIRMTFGARRADVLRLVALSAATSVGLGLVLGAALSLSLSRFVTRWVENGSVHPLMVPAVALLVIGVAAVVCVIPARKAVSVDPMTALREE